MVGPALFLISLAVSAGISWQVRGSLGLLAWMLVWLVTQCVRLEVTFSLPMLVVSAIPLAPWWEIVSVYWDPLVLFISGLLAWRWGDSTGASPSASLFDRSLRGDWSEAPTHGVV